MPKEAFKKNTVIAVPVTGDLKKKIKRRAKEKHYPTMSGYVRGLVRNDLEK